jgi:hypothetical protein
LINQAIDARIVCIAAMSGASAAGMQKLDMRPSIQWIINITPAILKIGMGLAIYNFIAVRHGVSDGYAERSRHGGPSG